MVFHDEAAFIREAIDSVLQQSFTDFELLLVDDGSSDASTDLARDCVAKDSMRIRYLEHPGHANRGISASRNLGLRYARGEFVAFLDADDRYRPDKLREQVALLDRLPDVDAVGGSVNYWASHEGGKDRIVPTGHVRNRRISPGEATIRFYPLGRAHAPSMSDLMFRRSSIDAAGGFEDAFTGAYEDQAFLAKFYLRSSLYLTPRVWSDYRLHADSCMATVVREGAYREARRTFLLWFERHLMGTAQRNDPAIRSALERALRACDEGAGRRLRRLREAVRSRVPTVAISIVRSASKRVDRLRPVLTPGPAILMYHRIAEETFDPWGMAVSPSNFTEHVEWLKSKRTVMPLAEFAERHRSGTLPRDAVALTFDDGYACNAQVAVPVLKKHGIPATIFLPPELIERGREFWWDELQRIVWSARGRTLTLNGQEFSAGGGEPDGDDHWLLGEPPKTLRQCIYRQLWAILYDREPEQLQTGMDDLRKQSGVPDAPRASHRPMTSSEIKAVSSELIAFGSHSLTHASLPLLDRKQKVREIGESVERCAELTGSRPRVFAYPYGNLDTEAQEVVEEAGFSGACRADGWFVSRRSSPFALPRIFVGNWNSDELARRIGRG